MHRIPGTVQLTAIERRAPSGKAAYEGAPRAFPHGVPTIASLRRIEFDSPVTLLVGENGSGKSTLLEALAVATELPAVGSARPGADPTLDAVRGLARQLRLVWRGRSRRGFFLRAEDFFGFQRRLRLDRADHETELGRVQEELKDASEWARRLAEGPHRASIAEMDRRYGVDPDAMSHGEAFLNLFASRLAPAGLYLLDEPEAALSPQSQLAFLAMMRDALGRGSQFIIATHAPILMATPGASILSFDEGKVRPADFDQLESVALVRDFLAAPERYLSRIWREPVSDAEAPPSEGSVSARGED